MVREQQNGNKHDEISLSFGRQNSSIPESEEFELQYNNQSLLRKSETKLLGFIFLDAVTWFDHIKCINSKIREKYQSPEIMPSIHSF